jgi:hypothetical protein
MMGDAALEPLPLKKPYFSIGYADESGERTRLQQWEVVNFPIGCA